MRLLEDRDKNRKKGVWNFTPVQMWFSITHCKKEREKTVNYYLNGPFYDALLSGVPI